MKVLLASAERFSGCIVAALERGGHEVVAVASPQRGIHQRGIRGAGDWYGRLRGWDIHQSCRKRGIEQRVSRRLEDGAMTALIKRAKPELLIVFGWPARIPEGTLALFPLGGMNIHPSQLPKLRGADPLFSLVDQKIDAFGITFHKLVADLDAGPIFLTIPLRFGPDDSYSRLYLRLLKELSIHLPRALAATSKHPEGTPQRGEATNATRFRQRMRVLDPEEDLVRIRRRTLACYSHHSRLTSRDGKLIHFSVCTPVAGFGSRFPGNGVIQKTGITSIVVGFSNRFARLSGIRIEGFPLWLTPFLLSGYCAPGSRLGSARATHELMRKKRRG